MLWTTIKIDGTIGPMVVITSPHPELERTAIEAARQSRYTPMKLDGQPVECQNRIVISYRLR